MEEFAPSHKINIGFAHLSDPVLYIQIVSESGRESKQQIELQLEEKVKKHAVLLRQILMIRQFLGSERFEIES